MPDISIEVSAILLGVYLVASAAMQVIIGFSMGEGTRGQGVSFLFRGMATMVYGISDSDAIEIYLSEKEFSDNNARHH
jgi:hypothetical protein